MVSGVLLEPVPGFVTSLSVMAADGGMWRWLGQMLFTGFTGFR